MLADAFHRYITSDRPGELHQAFQAIGSGEDITAEEAPLVIALLVPHLQSPDRTVRQGCRTILGRLRKRFPRRFSLPKRKGSKKLATIPSPTG